MIINAPWSGHLDQKKGFGGVRGSSCETMIAQWLVTVSSRFFRLVATCLVAFRFVGSGIETYVRTAELGNIASETFGNLRTVRAFNSGERLMEKKYCDLTALRTNALGSLAPKKHSFTNWAPLCHWLLPTADAQVMRVIKCTSMAGNVPWSMEHGREWSLCWRLNPLKISRSMIQVSFGAMEIQNLLLVRLRLVIKVGLLFFVAFTVVLRFGRFLSWAPANNWEIKPSGMWVTEASKVLVSLKGERCTLVIWSPLSCTPLLDDICR